MSHSKLTRRSFLSVSGLAAMALAGCSSNSQDDRSDEGEQTPEPEAPAEEPAAADAADIVITNATVQTMVSEDDVAETIAIVGNEIVFVGSAADAQAYVGEDTRVIDLGGGFVSPGFMDGHLHMPDSALTAKYNCVLDGMTTNEEYIEAMRAHVEANPDRDAYFGVGFMLNAFQQEDGSNPGPDRADLDAICPDKPVVISDVSYHSIWANSKAIEMGGVTAETPDPEGGFIYREADGTPHGCFTDAATGLIPVNRGDSYTEEQKVEACKDFLAVCNSYGLTGINDIDTMGDDGMKILHELEESGDLTLRINCVPTCAAGTNPQDTLDLINANQQYASDMLTCKTVKIFSDGVTESGTAYMLEPYSEAAGMGDDWYGMNMWSDEDMAANVALFNQAGIQVHVHAIGDAAVQQTIDAYVASDAPELRNTITHVCAIAPEDIQRMADNDIIAALQFVWMYYDPLCELEVAYVGEERALAFYPTREMWDAGIRISGASDGPVTSFNPLEEMEAGITRNSPFPGEEDTDMYRWADQALTPYELLQAYTTNVAFQDFCDDKVGTIEVGKKADLVCLDTNILTCDPKQISDSKVLFTISDGRVVFEG